MDSITLVSIISNSISIIVLIMWFIFLGIPLFWGIIGLLLQLAFPSWLLISAIKYNSKKQMLKSMFVSKFIMNTSVIFCGLLIVYIIFVIIEIMTAPKVFLLKPGLSGSVVPVQFVKIRKT